MRKMVESFLKWFAVYLGIAGLVTFSLFIMEESFQTTVFGTWPAQDAGDWQLVRQGIVIMENSNRAMKTVNYVAGWIQPLALLSYHHYGKSADFYIAALRAKAFANCPECFAGETVTFSFKPDSKEYDGSTIRHNGGTVTVLSTSEELPRRITGKVYLDAGRVIIDTQKRR